MKRGQESEIRSLTELAPVPQTVTNRVHHRTLLPWRTTRDLFIKAAQTTASVTQGELGLLRIFFSCATRSFYKVEQGLEFLFLASGALLLRYNLFIKLLPVHSLSRESSSDYFQGKVCEAPVCWDSGTLHLFVSPGSVFQLAVLPMDDNPCSSGAVSKRRDIPLCLWSNLRMNLWLPRNRNMETYWGVSLWQVVCSKEVCTSIYISSHMFLLQCFW